MEVQDYYNFKANGLNDKLTEAEKEEIIKLNDSISKLSAEIDYKNKQLKDIFANTEIKFKTAKGAEFVRKKLACDIDCTDFELANAFSARQWSVYFTNNWNQVCLITDSTILDEYKGNIYLTILIDVDGKKIETHMSLDRFLYLYEIGDFKSFRKDFAERYLGPIEHSWKVLHITGVRDELIKRRDNLMNCDTYKKYQKMYQEAQKNANKMIADVRAKEVRDVEAEAPVLKVKKKYDKKLADVKTIWNSTITEDEKAELIGWFTRHIIKMRIKVVDGGVSDKVISKAYPDDIYGPKYREKANSSGWDAASGIILVDSTENAPVETIKKLSTIKHMQHSKDKGETVFKGHTIHNLDLVLFLLSKYNKYGFKTGEKLNIDFLRLAKEEFNNSTAFAQGVIGC